MLKGESAPAMVDGLPASFFIEGLATGFPERDLSRPLPR
jgi:hypothetical protein